MKALINALFIISIFNDAIVVAQDKALKFEKLTIDDGLSQSTVTGIYKDKFGYMWFGTALGLNRYDGNSFKVYKNIAGDSTSLSSSRAYFIYEDRDSILWVGTVSGGINKFNREKETFEVVNVPNAPPYSNNVISIYEDTAGNLFFGTNGGGIIFLNKKTNTTRVLVSPLFKEKTYHANTIMDFFVHKQQLHVVSLAGIQKVDSLGNFEANLFSHKMGPLEFISIFRDKQNVIWIATTLGLGRVKDNDLFNEIEFPFKELNNTRIIDFAEDKDQNLWVCTFGKGLAVVNKDRSKIKFYKKDVYDPHSINSDDLAVIYKDNTNVIWIGGLTGGISKYDENVNKFGNYQDNYSDNILDLIEDKNGAVWFVSGSKGVTRWDPASNNVRNYFNVNFWQTGLCEDNYGSIWAVDSQLGISKFSPQKQQFILQFKYEMAYSILSGQDGKIYTVPANQGLKAIDPLTNQIEEIPLTEKLNVVYCLENGRNNNLWLGGRKGVLGEFNLETKKVSEHQIMYKDDTLQGRILSILEDSNGHIWIAAANRGVFVIHKDTKMVIRLYDHSNGMPNNDVLALLEDDKGKIWVSTSNGLCEINPTTNRVKAYTKKDGLVHNEFNANVAFKNKQGVLYFGGMEGFNFFDPATFVENTIVPPVVLTDFKIFNESATVGHKDTSSEFTLKESISRTKLIELSHDQDVFTFEFAALNFSLTEKNKYAYKMEGFDKDWIYSGTTRSATYTNLNPGNYLFRVKAANNDGVWNEVGTSVALVIHPPIWKTWWAYILYLIFCFFLIYIIWNYFINREKLQNELKLKSLESQKLQEVDGIKTRFYTNVSHEFRTPLTLILGPLDTAISLSMANGQKEIKRNLEMVNRNAQRLLELINQLMDFSKLESGNMKLHLQEADVISFLRTCTLSFSSLAVSKGIALQFGTTSDYLISYFDKDKLEKILNNLLSNALKFTREGGSVEVLVDNTANEMVLQVSDDGIGIPEDKVENIFNRYYQVDNIAKTYEGTGIGLALLKELVAFHNGTIHVQSGEGKGTVFTIKFPIKIKEVQKLSHPEKLIFYAGSLADNKNDNLLSEQTKKSTNGNHLNGYEIQDNEKEKPIILIVEDNHEIRSYIKSAFGKEYIMLESENGKIGLSIAEKNIPDLVITDIMMPEMDGQELCSILKTNEKTSHIPVIMLTAKASQESKMEGFETGADDYITKPFFLKELRVRAKNLIEQREKLRKRFTREVTLQPKEIAITSADENFLNRCMAVIETNMSNSDFSVDEFGREVGMSRSQLHRKLKALIDQSTSEFIRNIRLKRASELIKQKYGNTAEVAYEVGFNSVSYFIKCYKEVYGRTPGEEK